MRNNKRQRGLTLTEVVATGTVGALFVGVLLPAMAAGRSASLAARCAANLQRIGQAYALWAGDNNGFLPPRCRASAGCDEYTVATGFNGPGTITQDIPYREAPNDALSIVGEPTLKAGSYGAPNATYNDPGNFSLNPYVIPNWRLGRRMPTARCPADVDTLLAPDNNVAGIPQDTPASSFQLHGTSYYTNIEPGLPWRGHGAWAGPVESAFNRQVGPNYDPEVIYSPARYAFSFDMGTVFGHWQALFADAIGFPSKGAAWHDPEPPSQKKPLPRVRTSWVYSNALFLDGHVGFGEHFIPFKGTTLTQLGEYDEPTWALYPYRRRKVDIQNSP